ncbi:sensor histidine kinase [Streptomyces sp. KK5PA1]|uniref:histidine kinase n=2 Tax=Actinacidiphila acididurans TaxID=2784346 RepID=A0ABS2TZ20_9ACTN|nr:sensor histidine kinase [Actinacidiphila acididurans]
MESPGGPPPLLLPLPRRASPGVWLTLLWCAAMAFPLLVPRGPGPMPGGPVWFGGGGFVLFFVMAAAAVGASAMARHRPVSAPALLPAVTVVATAALRVLGVPLLEFVPVAVAVCWIAATWPRRVSVTVMSLLAVAGYTTTRLPLWLSAAPSTAALVGLSAVIAWLIGDSIRQNRLHAEALRARAAEQAVIAERLRIARELHDVIAHSVGVIAIQAGMGRRVIDTRPAEARAALATIEATSRETLAGLRRTLGALRRPPGTEGAGPAAGSVPLAPTPGLADLDRLASSTGDAGVRVRVRREGEPRPLPPDVELAAFRIVQESLTNVVRHAGTAECAVTVDYGAAALTVEVRDRGRGVVGGAPPVQGYGIAGMRERVALLRGEFAAGPHPEGGFRVAAVLPLGAGG